MSPPCSSAPADRPWSVPLLVTAEAEAWLLGWPAGLVTTAHDHGDATLAVSVVENRRPHSGHCLRRRIESPSSLVRESMTRESG